MDQATRRILEVGDICLYVRLGCSESEQAQPQKINVSVKLCCDSFQKAEATDLLEDAICYVKAAEAIERVSLGRSYHLIETLCSEIYKDLKEKFCNTRMSVSIFKNHPPHRLLHSGCRYTISDFDS